MSKPNEIAPWDLGADPVPAKSAALPAAPEAQNITPREVVRMLIPRPPRTGFTLPQL